MRMRFANNWLICLSLPRSSANCVRPQDLLQYIQEWNGSVDPEEVTSGIPHVGDIANCYDELNHNDCLDRCIWSCMGTEQNSTVAWAQWQTPTNS